ncbi:chitobiase/beta-hexosaminidase C-terminal domain-containing protein [bacterium]|nr:chitobiase/beta-hexosaminidase C-terminal domain-containing protein [bacterium]
MYLGKLRTTFLIVMLFLMLSLQTMAAVVYVKWDSRGRQDGKTWRTAYRSVITGIASARIGDEVWVAEGTYVVQPLALKQEVALYGGFCGNETSRDQRDYNQYFSILDGNMQRETVLATYGLTESAVLDGFVVTNGIGEYDVYGNYHGAGILCWGSPTITHNYIAGNNGEWGGGIYIGPNAAPLIAYNSIVGNSAYVGGGICSASGGAATVTNNYIAYNSAYWAGAIYIAACPSTISNNVIAMNTSGAEGAGILMEDGCTTLIVNNTIVDNETGEGIDGGGIYSDSSSPTIANNIIAFCSSGIYSTNAAPVLHTNDVYGNTDYDYSVLVSHPSDLNVDPLFRDYLGEDYHLLATSTLINAGTDADVPPDWPDMDGQDRINGAAVDIGADEVYVAETPVITPNTGSFNDYVTVTITDATPGVTIRYTTDDSTPTRTNGTEYTGPFSIFGVQVKAIAYSDAYDDSAEADTSFTWQMPTPTFDPPAGTYTSICVSINCSVPGATIYYTTDGSDPTSSSPVYTDPIQVNVTTILKAMAAGAGCLDSDIATAVYNIAPWGPSLVGLSPTSGTFLSYLTKYTISSEYGHGRGYQYLRNCIMLINTSMSGANGIYLRYDQKTGRIYLRNDTDTAWLGGYLPGSSSTLQNRQVIVYLGDTRVLKTKYNITVQWRIAIKNALRGTTCGVYLYADDINNLNTGWKQFGTYDIL